MEVVTAAARSDEHDLFVRLLNATTIKPLDTEHLEGLLNEAGTYGSLRNSDGRTLLHCACASGCLPAAELFVRQCDINDHDEAGWTALHSAASAGHVAVVKWLLGQPSIQLNAATETGGTPLHYASAKGHEVIVRALVNKGADVNLTDGNGHTPLMKAVCASRENVVEYLLSRPEVSLEVKERGTWDNLLHIAVNNKDIPIGGRIFKKAPHLAGQVNQNGQAPADVATTAELLEWKSIKEAEDPLPLD